MDSSVSKASSELKSVDLSSAISSNAGTFSSGAIRAKAREHMFNKFPRKGVSKKQILELCKEYAVQFVDMQFTDINGNLKALTIPVHKLEDALDNNVWFDGSSVKGFMRITESDMFLKPDLNTFAVLPWTREEEDVTARLICDVYLPDGTPYEGDPRGVLKRQMKEAEKLGLTFNTGPELEFFLFRMDEKGELVLNPHDKAGYFDQTTDLGLRIRRHMAFALDEMGIEVEALHHEVAEGQHEINFKFSDAVSTADNAITLKLVLKAIARRMGLIATFMPKPIFGINGSGMHVNQSLSDMEDGSNKFYDPEGRYGLSALALSFIAGQIKHIRAMNALMNPSVNSYKRLVIGYEAPVNAAWSRHNRSALIRVPKVTPSQQGKANRIELRCPDPSCNPYLAFAAMLAGGLDGIKKGMIAPDPVEDNIWELSSEEMEKRGISSVAYDLKSALDALRDDEVIRSAMGEELFAKFYETKMAEWEDYRTRVYDWEIERYADC